MLTRLILGLLFMKTGNNVLPSLLGRDEDLTPEQKQRIFTGGTVKRSEIK